MSLCVVFVAFAVATELRYLLTPSPLCTQGRAVRHRLRNYKVGRLGKEEKICPRLIFSLFFYIFPGECQMALCVGFVALAVLRSCTRE